jgi:Domain of unknown function (DUF4112)
MSRTNPRVVVRSTDQITRGGTEGRIRRVRVLGKLLDNSIPIPGTSWKIGLDPIIGLIPGVGDLAGALLSGYIVLEAVRAEVPTFTLVRMIVNVGIDTLLGAIPALGDVFDAAWKANTMNVALLERHLASTEVATAPNGRNALGVLAVAIVALVIIVGAGLALGIFAARLLWGLKTR